MFRHASMHFRSESLRADKRSPRSAEADGSNQFIAAKDNELETNLNRRRVMS